MDTTSDHIQTEIAQTRDRMSTRLDAISATQESGGGLGVTASLTQQVQKRPLLALGLSIAAGSVLKGVLSGGQGGSITSAASSLRGTAGGATSGVSGTLSQVGSTVSEKAGSASAGETVSSAASSAADTAAGAAQAVGDVAGGVAQTVGETASGAVAAIADTTATVAGQAVNTTSQVAGQVAETTGSVASTVSEQVSGLASSLSGGVGNLGTSVNQQVQQRPLTVLSAAVVTGAALQPTLAPQVSKVTQAVRTQASNLGSTISTSGALPNQQEVDHIRQALVPATVQRAKQFTTRELRDYLEQNLEGVLGQTSLRAGVVAAITEKGEEFAESRLPSVLDRSLSGTRGLLVAALLAQVLKARSQAQQGQGQTMSNITTGLTESVTQSSTEELKRHFPEFRQQYESQA